MAARGTSAVAVIAAAGGAWLAYAGVRDVPLVEGLRQALRGENPTGKAQPFRPKMDDKNALNGALSVFAGATGNIVPVSGITGGLDSGLAPTVTAMIRDAAAQGVTLTGGGYRSTAAQAALRLRNGCPDLTSPSSTCRVPTAPLKDGQSTSEHTKGLAIDFDLRPGVYTWLQANAGRYGLHQLPSERWHWSTTGK